ncbi:hypothetical protein M3182_13215 [Mesobacillus maritimus]|nr:hypothetical protein [Mesobacillus maritimus]MCM3586693.1 hypothetical protein [Mesobacillus maritimus]MCM3668553.1 hypothetical protein [Mesobacillus maritimus]
MEAKPMHYDGSQQNNDSSINHQTTYEPFMLTDEMRVNISGNPYFVPESE